MRVARLMLGAVFALLVLALVVGGWVCGPRASGSSAPPAPQALALETAPEEPEPLETVPAQTPEPGRRP